jgi:hypothetical protein
MSQHVFNGVVYPNLVYPVALGSSSWSELTIKLVIVALTFKTCFHETPPIGSIGDISFMYSNIQTIPYGELLNLFP